MVSGNLIMAMQRQHRADAGNPYSSPAEEEVGLRNILTSKRTVSVLDADKSLQYSRERKNKRVEAKKKAADAHCEKNISHYVHTG
jgi:hypothetical protein